MTQPAEDLEGKVLDGGWVVERKITRPLNGTGGSFSTGYIVSHPSGRKGFLKAMDYWKAFAAKDTAEELKKLTERYVFEKTICIKCADARITRVAIALDHGSHSGIHPLSKVEYLIFELADGDVRTILDQDPTLDLVFKLRTLHATAAALKQLHGANMAHQDVKPSNVLIFGADNESKLADLGRAWHKDLPAPHDGYQIPGDTTYAPYETFYGEPLSEPARRFGYDMYLLGSMVVFLFARSSMRGMVDSRLHRHYHSSVSPATYAEALPYLHTAFADAVLDFSASVPESVRDDLMTVVTELCNPDWKRRGNPTASGQRQYGLARYVSVFDRLLRNAEHALSQGP